MFTQKTRLPSFTVHLQKADGNTTCINRYREHASQRKQTLRIKAQALKCQKAGKSCAFFNCPLLQRDQMYKAKPVDTFGLKSCSLCNAQQKVSKWMESSFQSTVGVQTDKRDSETQTDPYSPEYVLRPGERIPEVLTLAPLTWGNELPAGLHEVEMIEKIRKRRAWEAKLPPLNDLTQVDKRNRMMAEMERKEWALRDKEIEELQEARLVLFIQILHKRKAEQDKMTMQQLNKRFSQLQREKEEWLSKIRRVFSLRKVMAQKKTMERTLMRQDISQTFVPLSGHVVFPDLSHLVQEPQIIPTRPKKHKKTELQKALKDTKDQVKEKKPLRFLYRVEKPVPRPLTPVVDAPPEGDEEKELAVIFLQKLLRGRSIQNQMMEGLEEQRELIEELRFGHILHQEDQELQRADKEITLALQREREICEERTSQAHSCIDGLSGQVVGDMLDFLAKEQVRLQEERKIHAFLLLAERDRRLREAEESGRRQMEMRRRREEDEIFRQVMNVHKSTVDLFLEDVVLGSIDETAEAQAREEIQHMAEEINNIAYAMEETRNNIQSEEIVSQLVYSFLIPEVHREIVRGSVRQSQRRHLTAARAIIYGTDRPSTSLQPPSPSTRASNSVLSQIINQVEEALQKSDHHQKN